MPFIDPSEPAGGKVRVFLSRRNLITLLSKLDRNRSGDSPPSLCTLIKRDNNHPKYPQTIPEIVVTAIEDTDYYMDREPGVVHPLDEPSGAKTNETE